MTPTGETPLLWKEITKYSTFFFFFLPTVNMVFITKLNNCFFSLSLGRKGIIHVMKHLSLLKGAERSK